MLLINRKTKLRRNKYSEQWWQIIPFFKHTIAKLYAFDQNAILRLTIALPQFFFFSSRRGNLQNDTIACTLFAKDSRHSGSCPPVFVICGTCEEEPSVPLTLSPIAFHIPFSEPPLSISSHGQALAGLLYIWIILNYSWFLISVPAPLVVFTIAGPGLNLVALHPLSYNFVNLRI